jgi:hypothetical protein
MDPFTIGTLASAAVNLLGPLFGKIAEGATKKAGEEVYTALREHLTASHASREPLAELESNPDDPDVQAALRVQLKKLIAADEGFAARLSRATQTATSTGNQGISMQAGDHATQIGRVEGNAIFGVKRENS